MKKLLLTIISFAFIACSGPKVTVKNESTTTNWNNYKTFDFYKLEASGDTITRFFKERTDILKDAIAKNLTSRGLTQNSENPDLLINIGLIAKQEISTRETSFTDADRPKYMGTRNYSWKSETVETGRYRNGFVTLDFIDAKQKGLLWQVNGNGVLPEKTEAVKKNIEGTISTLLKDFPVKLSSMKK